MASLRLAVAGLLAATAAVLPGCGKDGAPPPPPAPPAPARPAELSQQQAAELAAKLANEAFVGQKFRDPRGERVHVKVQLRPKDWQVAERKGGRWVFLSNPPAGPRADVSFDLDGNRPAVNVDFAFE